MASTLSKQHSASFNSIIALAAIALAGQVAADPQLSTTPTGNSPKNQAIAQCIDAIQGYHATEARLFLNNKASYAEVEGERVLNVNGWVWKSGERVKVSHQCTTRSSRQVAINVIFAEEGRQFAKR